MAEDHFERVARIGKELPGIEIGTSYGTPALRLQKKFFVRMREDGESLVVPCESVDEKEFFIATEPELYYQTPHYEKGPHVLVRLPVVTDERLRELLEAAFLRMAPPKLLREYESARG
jgi:hypothetical protein